MIPRTRFRPKSVFLTGANGFLGRAILKALLGEGIPVVCYTRSGFDTGNGKAECIVGELDDYAKIREALRRCDSVIHCAGIIDFDDRNYEKLRFVHVDAMANLIKASKEEGVRRFLYVSSHWTVGFSLSKDDVCTEDNVSYPDRRVHNVYQKTKLEGEKLLIREAGPMDYVIVNPSQIWGEENRNEILGRFIESSRSRRFFIVPSGGLNIVYVDDVARGIVQALVYGKSGERYILGGENRTFKEISYIFLKETGKSGLVIEIPASPIRRAIVTLASVARTLSPSMARGLERAGTSATYKFYSSEKARNEIGYAPVMSPEGIVRKVLEG